MLFSCIIIIIIILMVEAFISVFPNQFKLSATGLKALKSAAWGATSCANHYPTVYVCCTEVHLSFCNFESAGEWTFTLEEGEQTGEPRENPRENRYHICNPLSRNWVWSRFYHSWDMWEQVWQKGYKAKCQFGHSKLLISTGSATKEL